MLKYALTLATSALALTLAMPFARAAGGQGSAMTGASETPPAPAPSASGTVTAPAPSASATAPEPSGSATPAASSASNTWYLAQLSFDDPANIPAISDYKGPFDAIVAGAFANPGACEAVKTQFIELQKKAGSCSDPASCKAMAATFDKALQCVTDSDPRWGDTPPQKRWFLFFGAVMPEGKCRSQQQVLADRVASIFSSPDEAACRSKGQDFANSMLGKPAERPSPTPDCVYCIRGDDPILKSQP